LLLGQLELFFYNLTMKYAPEIGVTLKRCQAKIVCLVLGSSDLNYRTKQMEVGDAQSFGHESADRDSVP